VGGAADKGGVMGGWRGEEIVDRRVRRRRVVRVERMR